MEFDNPSDVERDVASYEHGRLTFSPAEHARREIKARRALRRWEDRQARLVKAARYLASTGRRELALDVLSAIDCRMTEN